MSQGKFNYGSGNEEVMEGRAMDDLTPRARCLDRRFDAFQPSHPCKTYVSFVLHFEYSQVK